MGLINGLAPMLDSPSETANRLSHFYVMLARISPVIILPFCFKYSQISETTETCGIQYAIATRHHTSEN